MRPDGFEKTAEEVRVISTKIYKLFEQYEVTGLRINNSFVEFHYQNVQDKRAGNEIDFEILQKLHRLLKPKRMSINAWTEVDGCERCKVAKDVGYVVAYFFVDG